MDKENSPQNEKWVDFRDVKQRVSMEMVLSDYGILAELKRSGRNLVGRCPIHQGSNPRQFSVNTDKNIWHCFGDCNAGGNVLDFTARMEGVDTRQAALLLQSRFPGGTAAPEKTDAPKIAPTESEREKEPVEKRRINPPLTFRLKTLKTAHPFFDERGILPATVKHFGLGYCTRGIMAGRIVIPIHDEAGELVAYLGRAVSDEQIEREGKYKLPANFVKSAVVYNLNRQDNPGTLILVESCLSVFHLHQHGFANTVALLGSSLSAEQEDLIRGALGSQGHLVLLFDADEAGEACVADCLGRLSPNLYVKAPDLKPHAAKPHQLSFRELVSLI